MPVPKVLPPMHHMLARAKAEIPLFGASREEIRRVRPMAQTGVPVTAAQLNQVERICLFIGHPRSGHSLVGAMLNAHPDVCIAHELDLLAFLREGWTAPELMWACLENARRSAVVRQQWGAYRYEVPGQWQGKHRQLRVIGDKKGGLTATALLRDPTLLDRLLATFDVPIRWIHVVRNPWDNITTVHKKHRASLVQSGSAFFAVAQAADALMERVDPASVHRLTVEELTADPKRVLAALARFLEVDPDPAWIEACAKLVWPRPSRPRDQVQWSPALQQAIRNLASRHSWLKHYRFDD